MPSNNQKIFLNDYKKPNFTTEHVDLEFDLHETETIVNSHLKIKKNPDAIDANSDLVLNGEKLVLESLLLNGKPLDPSQYEVTDKTLTIRNIQNNELTLDIKTKINPQANKELSGLYVSKGNYCSHCESEGFRRITYFQDRPDVLATYTTTIIADEKNYPTLLSNGNRINEGKLANGRHWVKWDDPIKKPTYLFALIGGNYDCVHDEFKTFSGKKIKLECYAEKGDGDKCDRALKTLKKAMRWDEDNFGRECDVPVYRVVAVSDYNTGASENKGINLFNAKYILSTPEGTADDDLEFMNVAMPHEYFHNWTGNRVTIRDWFQLCLKEGLTEFRDQLYTEDNLSPALGRMHTLKRLLTRQFPQDASSLATPVQPMSYETPRNLYTMTTYAKGAELFRLFRTVLGKEMFRKGMELYFDRHDGQAVTIEAFVQAMSDVSKLDLSRYLDWFHQSGTPLVKVTDEYRSEDETYVLNIEQNCPPTQDQAEKKMLPIPVRVGLIDKNGCNISFSLDDHQEMQSDVILNVDKAKQSFYFHHVKSHPIPSLLRHFSAPVKLTYDYQKEDLLLLAKFDEDLYNRAAAIQQYIRINLEELLKAVQHQKPLHLSAELIQIFKETICDSNIAPALRAEMVAIGAVNLLASELKTKDLDAVHTVREFMVATLAKECKQALLKTYLANNETLPGVDPFTNDEIGKRKLKNNCLQYLTTTNDPEITRLIVHQFNKSLGVNMSDSVNALKLLVNVSGSEKQTALDQFYHCWEKDSHAIDYWLEAQASSNLPTTLNNIREILQHPIFDLRNPDKVRALLGEFCANFPVFHQLSGAGYQLLTDIVLKIDQFNPELAVATVRPLALWENFDSKRQALILEQLNYLKQHATSTNLKEIINQSLPKAELPIHTNPIATNLAKNKNSLFVSSFEVQPEKKKQKEEPLQQSSLSHS